MYGLFFLLIPAVLFCSADAFSQENPTPLNEFLIGGFCASMHNPYQQYIYLINYHQILECGLNSVYQKAKWTNPQRNIDSLNLLKFVYTANDTAPVHTTNPDDVDWISYFTHAKYYRWEAEGDEYFPEPKNDNRSVVGVKHNGVGYIAADRTGYSSGTGKMNSFFIDGPDYTQYKRYVYTNRNLDNPHIQYNAVFMIKLAEIPERVTSAAKIMVTVYNTETKAEYPLAGMVLKTDTLTTEYQPFTLSYNYYDYLKNRGKNSQLKPGMNGGAPWLDLNLKVRFKVQTLTNDVEVIVDYVEVYDAGKDGIWEYWFKDHYHDLVRNIADYNHHYDGITSDLYYGTIDEPHSWDSFIPIKKVQHILDSLKTGRNLLVHFCPEWDNRKEGVTVLDKWVNIAQPAKLMFWYAPFSCWFETTEYCKKNPQELTLWDLRKSLQISHLLQPGFFVTLQTWGSFNTTKQDYEDYSTPTPAGISAETMLSLAHGVKGIYYEDYYSYRYGGSLKNVVEALVDIPENNFAITNNWLKVQALAKRLKGTFGQTLLSLSYTAKAKDNGFLRLARNLDSRVPETPPLNQQGYVILAASSKNPPSSSYNFHCGFFKNQPDNNYFLLADLITTNDVYIKITVTPPDNDFINYRFRNIEPEYNFDVTFNYSYSVDYRFPPGEGYLFQVAPVVKYGGKLYYDETVTDLTLYDDMTIENGVTLTVNGTYECNANIYTKGTGKIKTLNNGVINFHGSRGIIAK